MKRLQILCLICSATILLQALQCSSSETNTIPASSGDKITEEGPLKGLAAYVLTNGVETELGAPGTLKPKRYNHSSTFPPMSAIRLGLVSTNNEPFMVYGLNAFFPDPVYNDPSEIAMLRVSVQRGRTDIIFASSDGEPAFGHCCEWKLYLTSPRGDLQKAWICGVTGWVDLLNNSQEPDWVRKDFHRHIDFWLQRLSLEKSATDQKK